MTSMGRLISSKEQPWDEAPGAAHLQGLPHRSRAKLWAVFREPTCPLWLPLHGGHHPLEEGILIRAPHCAIAESSRSAASDALKKDWVAMF